MDELVAEKTSIFRTDGKSSLVKKRMKEVRELQSQELFDSEKIFEKIMEVSSQGYSSYTWPQLDAVDYSNTEHCSNITAELEREGFVVRWEEMTVLPSLLQNQETIKNIANSKIKIRLLQVKWA